MIQPLVLVVGMHRSGTSLLAGVLNTLGITFPGKAIEADIHNPDGYFEWAEVVHIQERLLIDLERWWPSPQGTFALPNDWLAHPATVRARLRLHTLLQCEVLQQNSLWAIKDPRCSRLLPLWFELARDLGIPLKILLAVRNPAEVITSLVNRDGPITGMDSNRAQQLWWRHNLEVVEATHKASHSLSIVDFNSWFQDPTNQISSLVASLPGLNISSNQFDQALALINPKYRRSLHDSNRLFLHPSVRGLYKRLIQYPLPKRMPSSTPPIRLARKLLKPSSADSLSLSSSTWDSWLDYHRHYPAPVLVDNAEIGNQLVVELFGSSWLQINSHLWLQRIPCIRLDTLKPVLDISNSCSLVLRNKTSNFGSLHRIFLNFCLPAVEHRDEWLRNLKLQQIVFDPDPPRVLLLRYLGINAFWLDPEAPGNGWLDQTDASSTAVWARLLGISAPHPDSLILLGSAGPSFDRGLAAEVSNEANLIPAIQYLPGWNELIVETVGEALSRAGWFHAAVKVAARLVVTSESSLPEPSLLVGLKTKPILISLPSDPVDLRSQHSGVKSMAIAEDRPTPTVIEKFNWSDGDQPSVSVLISLYNYSDRIVHALNSVAQQSSSRIELIVVDDASSDSGSQVVLEWMLQILKQSDHHFSRLLLLRHSVNTGLASARNTAFASATSPWCFVLDADNALYPQALQYCLKLINCADQKLAVVHPLLFVEAEPGRPDEQRSLVSTASWQRSRLLSGNVVDAMALIRHSAWAAVGGYTHIEFGWEDYDFWCKLTEAGYYGIQCSSILGVYRSHQASMSNCFTNSNWLFLSRTLQYRHPWLQLTDV